MPRKEPPVVRSKSKSMSDERGSAKRPRVSVIVLTCNRREELRHTLQRIQDQTLEDTELIVVDNDSKDGTAEMVSREFPAAKLISLPDNCGCAGRNAGMRSASGEILVTLDDDVCFSDRDTLAAVERRFARGDVEVICFRIVSPETGDIIPNNWYHPRPLTEYQHSEFETDYISEGAVAFKKSIFSKTGYYPEDFFLGQEGYDLALRIIDNGFKMWYSPEIEVIHNHSLASRTAWRNPFYDTRNTIWLLIRHYPWRAILLVLPYKLMTCFVFCVSRGQWKWYFRGLWAAFKGSREQVRMRKPIKPATWARLKRIRSERPGFRTRLKEFMMKNRMRSQIRGKLPR